MRPLKKDCAHILMGLGGLVATTLRGDSFEMHVAGFVSDCSRVTGRRLVADVGE